MPKQIFAVEINRIFLILIVIACYVVLQLGSFPYFKKFTDKTDVKNLEFLILFKR